MLVEPTALVPSAATVLLILLLERSVTVVLVATKTAANSAVTECWSLVNCAMPELEIPILSPTLAELIALPLDVATQ